MEPCVNIMLPNQVTLCEKKLTGNKANFIMNNVYINIVCYKKIGVSIHQYHFSDGICQRKFLPLTFNNTIQRSLLWEFYLVEIEGRGRDCCGKPHFCKYDKRLKHLRRLNGCCSCQFHFVCIEKLSE